MNFNPTELQSIVESCFEARYLKRIQRNGNALLLGNEVEETIVEHSFYVSLRGLVYSYLNPSLDKAKLLTMCIIHDLGEVRTGDLNQVNSLYGSTNQPKAFQDMRSGSNLGGQLNEIFQEIELGTTPEAKAHKDCDLLAQLLAEKEYQYKGNAEANERMERTVLRLKTDIGKQLGEYIINGRISSWREKVKNNIRISRGFPAKEYN